MQSSKAGNDKKKCVLFQTSPNLQSAKVKKFKTTGTITKRGGQGLVFIWPACRVNRMAAVFLYHLISQSEWENNSGWNLLPSQTITPQFEQKRQEWGWVHTDVRVLNDKTKVKYIPAQSFFCFFSNKINISVPLQ